jgi:hypothetical protein
MKMVVMILMFFSFGFAQIQEGKERLQSLVVGYNHGLIKAAQKNKFEHLKAYLTQQIYYKTLVWIESYQDSNLFMDALMLNVQFNEAVFHPHSASLQTKEVWKYRYINTKTKEVVKAPEQITYTLKYHFVFLKNGQWKINHIKILDEKSTAITNQGQNRESK